MADTATSVSTDILRVLVPGVLGALSAIAGQIIANYFSNRRHREEMKYREKQLNLQFLTPYAERRLTAYETVYEQVQRSLEEKSIARADYERIRPLLLYLTPSVREEVISSLTALVSATSGGDHERIEEAVANVKKTRELIESTSGRGVVDSGIAELMNEIN